MLAGSNKKYVTYLGYILWCLTFSVSGNFVHKFAVPESWNEIKADLFSLCSKRSSSNTSTVFSSVYEIDAKLKLNMLVTKSTWTSLVLENSCNRFQFDSNNTHTRWSICHKVLVHIDLQYYWNYSFLLSWLDFLQELAGRTKWIPWKHAHSTELGYFGQRQLLLQQWWQQSRIQHQC